jgi:hypothetical protein
MRRMADHCNVGGSPRLIQLDVSTIEIHVADEVVMIASLCSVSWVELNIKEGSDAASPCILNSPCP